MTRPIASLLQVAATPSQAQVMVAQLQAAGIPAHVDGDSLADEFAVSRRLMNLGGTRVMVPTASLERAREVLAAGRVDAEELTAQALAADPEVAAAPAAAAAPRPRPTARPGLRLLGLVLLCGGTFALARVTAPAAPAHPLFDYRLESWGLRETPRHAKGYPRELRDEDRDGLYEQVVERLPGGTHTIGFDRDRDGHYEEFWMVEADGSKVVWSEGERPGMLDRAKVLDRDGKTIQELRWETGRGFVPVAR